MTNLRKYVQVHSNVFEQVWLHCRFSIEKKKNNDCQVNFIDCTCRANGKFTSVHMVFKLLTIRFSHAD